MATCPVSVRTTNFIENTTPITPSNGNAANHGKHGNNRNNRHNNHNNHNNHTYPVSMSLGGGYSEEVSQNQTKPATSSDLAKLTRLTLRHPLASFLILTDTSHQENEYVTDLYDAGFVVVVAAGNDNDDACNYSPASAADAITVGSSTINDEASYFSNYGTCNDIYAPGSDIYSVTTVCDQRSVGPYYLLNDFRIFWVGLAYHLKQIQFWYKVRFNMSSVRLFHAPSGPCSSPLVHACIASYRRAKYYN